ncbi:uncharacterized protein LMH87_008940 [Akanthomyces muscarius]|uniref:Uncharacterized protein n=1 Tax=Akanthomyces muscarius TaxID=2231603 RepID=A0A9W8QI69_AKAMU|nr:uncharacterized protein LMH87_008940 [Akanthomyces muscarius]KAJ4158413.1 hypothetical protein LMH87_008940 [Akanthomyces muscarius]
MQVPQENRSRGQEHHHGQEWTGSIAMDSSVRGAPLSHSTTVQSTSYKTGNKVRPSRLVPGKATCAGPLYTMTNVVRIPVLIVTPKEIELPILGLSQAAPKALPRPGAAGYIYQECRSLIPVPLVPSRLSSDLIAVFLPSFYCS